MSFGKPELPWETLGVRPARSRPLALINDRAARAAHVVLDRQMLEFERLNYHPLHNEAKMATLGEDFLRFLSECANAPTLVNFYALEALAAEDAAAN